MNIWSAPLNEIFHSLNSTEKGLKSASISDRQKTYGFNVIQKKYSHTAIKILFNQFTNPLILILLVVVVISFWTKDNIDGIVILSMLLINAILGFVQEYRAKKSLDRLQKLIKINCKVLRDDEIKVIDSTQLVPGDIILLNKGDYVPADIRLLTASNLFINESSLTGESIDVAKDPNKASDLQQPHLIKNGVFQGTYVSEGNCRGVVVNIGKSTFLGSSVEIGDESNQDTNFIKKMRLFTNMLFAFVALITTTSFLINISLGRDILSSFILGITLALGITPETMPVILSLALSNAAYALSKKKLLVKRLTVFEDLGNLDVLCSDKTGTITNGVLHPAHFFDIHKKESDIVKQYSILCNAQNPMINYQIMPNSIDDVLAKNVEWKKVKNFDSIDKVWDFDFNTRMMAVSGEFNGRKELIIKGAYEVIVSKSNLKDIEKEELIKDIQKYELKGYRIIGIGRKNKDTEIADITLSSDFEIVGFILLIDEPRENMRKEFDMLEKYQVSLKIITGDSADITREICRKVGLDIVEDKVLIGSELEKLSDEKFKEYVNKYNIFARVSPLQKLSIIQALKDNGHVVGYIGDGVNDVGALKSADVGISVDTGVDVAKDCSDLILLEKDLSAVTQGVLEGRKVFSNTMKFIFGTMSSSFGNVITITFASLFLKFLPLLPVQVILLDSLTDFQHLAISTDNVDEELISKPRNWDMNIFAKYAIFWGLISTVFDFFHILVISAVTSSPELFRTTWMIESVTTELVSTLSIRTHNLFFKSKPSLILLVFSVIPLFGILFLAYSALGDKYFDMEPVSAFVLIVVFLIVLLYFIAMEFSKRKYFERFWGVKYR